MKVGDIIICKKDSVYNDIIFAFVGMKFQITKIGTRNTYNIKCVDTLHPNYDLVDKKDHVWFVKRGIHVNDSIEYIWKYFITPKGKANKIRKKAKTILNI